MYACLRDDRAAVAVADKNARALLLVENARRRATSSCSEVSGSWTIVTE
jgi:hypothetical protein